MDIESYGASKQFTKQEVTRIVNRETDTDAMSRQAAVDADGVDKVNLKQRLDDDINGVRSQLADNATNVKDFGAKGDGVTDDSISVLNALDALFNLGGGTLYFPRGTYVITSQLAIPVDGDGNTVPIKIKGVASRAKGVRTCLLSGGSALDLRYGGSNGKIFGSGFGSLGIEDIHLFQTGPAIDTTPFVFITHSTPYIQRVSVQGHSTLSGMACIQDAFVFGNTLGTMDEPPYPAFRGYGGCVRDCVFDRIRSGIVGRKGWNGFLCENLGWSINCGSDSLHGAIDLNGTGDQASANTFLNMVMEIMGYPYPVMLNNASLNVFIGTQFWDVGVNTLYLVNANSSNKNTFIGTNSFGFANKITGNTQGDTYWHEVGTGIQNLMNVTKLTVTDEIGFTGSNSNADTALGGHLGIVLKNIDPTVGNYTSISNYSKDGAGTAAIYFKNIDQQYAGAIDFITRSLLASYNIRQRIDPDGNIIMTTNNLIPASGALLTLNSLTKGFRPPAMTTTQRNAIVSPSEGLIIYNTTTHTLDIYNGALWAKIDADMTYNMISTWNTYTASQLITDYPDKTVTTYYIDGGGAVGFPGGSGGIVTVYRLNGNGYSRMEFRRYDTNEIWTRSTSIVDGSWKEWVKVGTGQGTSALRPTTVPVGYNYFDTTLGKPIWLKTAPSTWVDATGTTV